MSPTGPNEPRTGETLALPNGLVCRVPSRKMLPIVRSTIREVFHRERYARPGFELAPGDNVIDVGANIGIFTLWASSRLQRGRVLAVEPSPAVEILRSNLAANGIRNVIAERAAVGRADGELELEFYPYADVMSRGSDQRRPWPMRLLMARTRAKRVTVPTLSLGQVLERSAMERVDYLKIDCEGGEFELCRAARPEDWRRIRRVSLEYHEYRADQRHEELVSILRRHGFRVEVRGSRWRRTLTGTGDIWARRAA
jgi:FkbM family methyltransferase